VIRYYTREAGVRSLEREIGKIWRVKGLQLKKMGSVKSWTRTTSTFMTSLGVRKFRLRRAEKKNQVGAGGGPGLDRGGRRSADHRGGH
jgi:ATP-dependent Lon protease